MHGSQFGRRSSTELVLKQNTEKDSMLQQEQLAEQNWNIHIYLFVQHNIFTNPLHYKQPLCPLMAQVMFCRFVPDFFRMHFP